MTVLIAIGVTYALWVFYIIVMGLYRAQLAGRLSPVAKVMGYPFLVIGLAIDILVNLTVASLLFLEFPRETLVTSRLTRHLQHSTGWRHRFAFWICSHLLDPFDPTDAHCD